MSKRKEETTQELLGIKELREYGVRTYRKEELAYFLIRPSNLSVLSEEKPVGKNLWTDDSTERDYGD